MDATDRHKRASEEATEWLIVLQQDDAPSGQRGQFIEWLRESPLHVAAMLRVAQVHGALEHFNRWALIPTDGSGDDDTVVVPLAPSGRNPAPEATTRKPQRTLLFAGSIAATLLLALAIAVLLPRWRSQVIQTERAERREVALADGSVAQLDPETTLRVKYQDHARRVLLERGRALFHVAKNKDRPFLVDTRDTTIKAIGTAFAVEQKRDSIVVTVAEGQVEIIPSTSVDTPAIAPGAQSNSTPPGKFPDIGKPITSPNNHRITDASGSPPRVFLVANQQITVDRSGSAEPVHAIDSTRALAWAEGRLIFDYSTLGDAINQFNKYNSIQLMVSDPMLANRPISGVFNASDPESFVAFIQTVTSVRVTRTSGSDIAIDPVK